jgi:hypothetical protein
VRRHASIGIDFVRREWQNRALGSFRRQTLECAKKECDVRDGLFEVAVGRDDVEHRASGDGLGGGRGVERLRRRSQPGCRPCGRIHSAAQNGRLEQREQVEGRRRRHQV